MKKKDIYYIVLADDDADDRELFREALNETHKTNFKTAKDGLSLMQLLKDSKELPDAIFLDLNMPRMDGHACLKEIKKDKKLHDIPVVIYSTSKSPQYIEETYKDGASLYITKPDSFTKLKKVMEKVFSLDCDHYVPQPPKNEFVLAV
ncbi:MAG: response regulator [Bacteroidota bacterium]|nr:response regulator [Bacteroidota bacterium]